jgi:FdhD protein
VRVPNQTFAAGAAGAGERSVPEETPVALTYGRQTHAVMLATPSDLEDFAVGFSLTEEIVQSPADILELEVLTSELGVELRMDLREERQTGFLRRRRSLVGATGCGLCGMESLSAVAQAAPQVRGDLTMTPAMIASAMAAMAPAQTLNRETRAVHAAGFWMPKSGLVALREDVGRHNALDKLTGALARQGIKGCDGAVLLTSRVSVEMVQKTARLGATIVIAVSAPTALAIRTAEQCGLTLVAIARDRDFEIFTHPERIGAKDAAKEIRNAS